MLISQTENIWQIHKEWTTINLILKKLKNISSPVKNKVLGCLNGKWPVNNFTNSFDKNENEEAWKQILSFLYNNNDFEIIWQSWKKLIFKTIDKDTKQIWSHVVKLNMQDVFEKIFDAIHEKETKTIIHTNDIKELERFDELYTYFDAKNILKPQIKEKEIIITDKNLIDRITKKAWLSWSFNGEEIVIEIPYSIKPTAMEKIEDRYVSFNFDYTPGAFKKYLWLDLNNRSHDLPVTWQQVKKYLDQRFNDIIEQIAAMKNDSAPIIKLFKGILHFTQDHNQILDIYGFDNFTFFVDKQNDLDFHLLDPIHPNNIDTSHPWYKKRWRRYIPLDDKRFIWFDSKIINFDTYSDFAYPYILEKMKTYIKEKIAT